MVSFPRILKNQIMYQSGKIKKKNAELEYGRNGFSP
jgi:hypothetical protein